MCARLPVCKLPTARLLSNQWALWSNCPGQMWSCDQGRWAVWLPIYKQASRCYPPPPPTPSQLRKYKPQFKIVLEAWLIVFFPQRLCGEAQGETDRIHVGCWRLTFRAFQNTPRNLTQIRVWRSSVSFTFHWQISNSRINTCRLTFEMKRYWSLSANQMLTMFDSTYVGVIWILQH